ncbi:hypothetical protein L9F63_015617, partial [Diploptera punctata]
NEKDTDVESNTDIDMESNADDFQHESVDSPVNDSNDVQNFDELYEEISDTEIASDSLEKDSNHLQKLSTEKQDTEDCLGDKTDSPSGQHENGYADSLRCVLRLNEGLTNPICPFVNLQGSRWQSDTIIFCSMAILERYTLSKSKEFQNLAMNPEGRRISSDRHNISRQNSTEDETVMVSKSRSTQKTCMRRAEKVVRKRTSLEDNADRIIKRTKVTGNSSEDGVSAIEKKKGEVKDIPSEIKEVAKVVDQISEPKEDKANKEGEVGKSNSVSGEKENKGDKKCSVLKDKESEVARTGTKRIHEQVGLIEVKKVRITPEMENQLSKLSNSEKLQKNSTDSPTKVLLVNKTISQSTKDQNDQHKQTDSSSVSSVQSKEEILDNKKSTKNDEKVTKNDEKMSVDEDSTKKVCEKKQVEGIDNSTNDNVAKESNDINLENKEDDEENRKKDNERIAQSQQLKNSLPPRSPKSNLDLAIERVVLGLTEDSQDTIDVDKPKEPKKLNPMPLMRNLQDNLLKNLSRNDLEEFLMQKMCEVVTDRCTIGDMRQRCQTLEQMIEQWRKKVQQLQKQLKDMEMVMKRYIGDARTRKERPIPVKITRSVGLQVHMGPMNAGMLRNRSISNDPSRNQGQIRRRANRVSSPPTKKTSKSNHSRGVLQKKKKLSATIVPSSAVFTTFRSLSPSMTISRPSITTTAQLSANKVGKVAPSPVKPVGRPITSIAAAIATGSPTSTVNTMNTTVVNTANNLRIASAAQLNNRQPVKQIAFAANKSCDFKIIDLTDEEDKSKSSNLRAVNPSISTVTANMISTSAVTTGVSITAGTSIQGGSIRVVQPHQLTGTTATTLLAPSTTPTSANSRLAYFVPTSGASVQQRQLLIASSGAQIRPGVMNVQNRQNQLPTLVFKNGTVVPIPQASGTQQVNTAILRPSPMQTGQLQQVLPTRPGQQIRVTNSLVTTVGRMTTPTIANVPILANKHPAPLPNPPNQQHNNPNWKFAPPKPELKITKGPNKHQQGIVLSWNMTLTSDYEEIASYQLYAYQEGSAQPNTNLWKKVGDVKALPLPMACTLTQFLEGHKYHFAVRAVDVHMRVGPFSAPGNIVLTRK